MFCLTKMTQMAVIRNPRRSQCLPCFSVQSPIFHFCEELYHLIGVLGNAERKLFRMALLISSRHFNRKMCRTHRGSFISWRPFSACMQSDRSLRVQSPVNETPVEAAICDCPKTTNLMIVALPDFHSKLRKQFASIRHYSPG